MSRVAVLAYSGGLDTTFCAVWLRQQGFSVHTVAVQTGGFSDADLRAMEHRAAELGVTHHEVIDGQNELYSDFLKYLIFGNVLRGEVYPLCVSAERLVQARAIATYATRIGADALAHGSTGAGNDQVRFDTAFRVLAPDLEVITPIRALGLSRDEEVRMLAEAGVEVPARTGRYSVNIGLWGATIGGGETHRSDAPLPEDAYVMTARRAAPGDAERVTLEFRCGIPVAVDETELDPVSLIARLNERAGRWGIGRGMHVGDTILGIKGRVAFEAPAATVLITAHRELEKLVLSRQQMTWKRTLGDLYGSNLHESRYFDPVMRDIEAFLESSQSRVSGTVTVRFEDRLLTVLGASSPYSLMDSRKALYGEGSSLWTAEEAAAFSRIYGIADAIHAEAGTEK